MKNMTRFWLLAVTLFGLIACGGQEAEEGHRIEASGREATDLEAVPAEVLAVAEIQRDIGMDLVPERVSNTLDTKFPGWAPERIIESDQGGGVVVYEFFGKTDEGEATKIEVKLEDGHAELLIDEWLH